MLHLCRRRPLVNLLVKIVSHDLAQIVDFWNTSCPVNNIRNKRPKIRKGNVGDRAVGIQEHPIAGQTDDLADIVDASRHKGSVVKVPLVSRKPCVPALSV